MITPQSLKLKAVNYKLDRQKEYQDNKAAIVQLVLNIMNNSVGRVKAVALADFYQPLTHVQPTAEIPVDVAELFKDNIDDIKQELVNLGFKFNTQQIEYIVFEEQGE